MIDTKEQKREQRRIDKENKQLQAERRARELKQQIIERGELTQKEKEENEKKANRLPELEKMQDEYLNWLIDNEPTHPKWFNVVGKYHAVEVQIKTLTTRKPYFSGINELSTLNLK
jgi:uncharacterized protein (UPF0305 family)